MYFLLCNCYIKYTINTLLYKKTNIEHYNNNIYMWDVVQEQRLNYRLYLIDTHFEPISYKIRTL